MALTGYTSRRDPFRPGGTIYEIVIKVRGVDRPLAATSLEDLEKTAALARAEEASWEKNGTQFLTDPQKWEGP